MSHKLGRFARDEDGATLVELSVVMAIFVLMFFGLIDFARYGFTFVMAEKATQQAVRLAVVSPAICDEVPAYNDRGSDEDAAWGTDCTASSGICASVAEVACTGADSETAAAIYDRVKALLPRNADAASLKYTYAYDPALGYLGGPFTPVVSVEITGVTFSFITPLGRLAGLATGAGEAADFDADFTFPGLSASLPAENIL